MKSIFSSLRTHKEYTQWIKENKCTQDTEDSVMVSLKFEQLGLKGYCKVRDLWAKKDIVEYTDEISLTVRKHGAKLIKILPQ